MRRALRGTSIRGHGQLPQPVFDVQTMPPPVGGWNYRDTVALMEGTDAVRLDNWIPDTNNVRMRGGYELHATIGVGTAAAVETLIPYHPPNTTSGKLFAAVGSRIVDVTAEVTASSTGAVVTGLSNARWQHDQLTNAAGAFLVICNGQDAPRRYDGSTWVTATITASGTTLPATSLIAVRNHMNRLWYTQENSLIPWYGGVNEISGVLTQFIVPFRRGGKLMTIASWTVDGGSGQDDLIVFISSRGECVLYAGTDPGSVNTWGLQGRYDIPDVIGRRCVVNAGSDLGILTVQGLVPLSQVIHSAVGAAQRVSFTDKISGYFRNQFPVSGGLFGWEVLEYPRGNLVIINVPLVENSEANQAISNINTGAWAKFVGLNANCWAVLNENLYFGGTAAVYHYDNDLHSDGDDQTGIIGVMVTAHTTLGSVRTKRFSSVRPIFLAPPGQVPAVSILTNYASSAPVTITVVAEAGTQWADEPGVAGTDPQWDTFLWAGGVEPVLSWDGTAGEGRSVAIAFALSSTEELIYNGCDIGFEVGNYS